MLNETPLVGLHKELGGKLVDFGGWNMPLHYGSQMEEHHAVRKSAGVFDVSHMTIVDVEGAQAKEFLQYLLANDVAKLAYVGKALYSGMLAEDGGVIDDLIVYLTEGGYRLVVNCATREKDLAWIAKHAGAFDVSVEEQPELAMVAVQGPEARERVNSLLRSDAVAGLNVFSGVAVDIEGQSGFVARTGYTGEDGYEIILPNAVVEQFTRSILAAGVVPCGLGARDTLRLEAGMNLYGHEMDEAVSPLVANMAWTIAWQPNDRNFIGRAALERQKAAGVEQKLVGLVIEGKGVLRASQELVADGSEQKGIITSGSFSPTLATSVALARVPHDFNGGVSALIRNKLVPVTIVKPCFVRNGEKVF